MRPRRPKQYCLQLVLYIYIYIYIYINNIFFTFVKGYSIRAESSYFKTFSGFLAHLNNIMQSKLIVVVVATRLLGNNFGSLARAF